MLSAISTAIRSGMNTTTLLVRHFDKIFLTEAALGVRRAQGARARGNDAIHGSASFTAIVAGAAAVEAYISEIAAHQLQYRLLAPFERDAIKKEKEVPKKFRLLLRSWAVHNFHKEPLYLDLCALMALRNCLIHRSAEFMAPGEWPEKLRAYRGRIPHAKGEGLDWTSQLLNADTAAWAHGVGRRVLEAARKEIPDPAALGLLPPPAGSQ